MFLTNLGRDKEYEYFGFYKEGHWYHGYAAAHKTIKTIPKRNPSFLEEDLKAYKHRVILAPEELLKW